MFVNWFVQLSLKGLSMATPNNKYPHLNVITERTSYKKEDQYNLVSVTSSWQMRSNRLFSFYIIINHAFSRVNSNSVGKWRVC